MKLPFLDLFKRKAVKEHAAPSPVALAPVDKRSSERLSKTVLPNSTRTVGPEDSISLEGSPASRGNGSSAGAPRTVSFGSDTPMSGRGIPPAVALALEPKVERAISLELSEVVRQMPAGLVRPLQVADANRRVLLKASELEKGMASGKPTVSVASVYQQIPEIFLHTIAPTDGRQVQLPVAKVLEQITSLQLRADQYRDQVVPQVETPFLQVTLEDNSKFGITMEPIQTGDLPPVRLQPATAEAIAAAEPEPASRHKFSLNSPPPAATSLPAPAPGKPEPNAANGASAPARIPFKITPIGTGAPASERVPASSGPSVPTSFSGPAAPTRIPFKMKPPSDGPPPKAEPWLTKESLETLGSTESAPAPASKEEKNGVANAITISLALKPILQNLPPFQLTRDISGVPEDARVEVPFSLIEPQLVTGRVSLTPEQFAAALPEAHRDLFSAKEIAAPVALPLEEVLKSLPAASLRMRDDQEEQEKGAAFETPFSAKAQEDAKRFQVSGTPVAKASNGATPAAPKPVAPTPVPEVLPAPAAAVVVTPPVKPETPSAEVKEAAVSPPVVTETSGRSALQTAFDTDDELDAKAVVAHVGRMAGVKACAIMFGDGLSLAGNLPEVYEADGLCAMAPSLLQRIEDHMAETKLGALRAMTISCAHAAVTFFMHDNLCLAALHAKDELAADVRERLARAVHELSRQYSHPV